MEEIIIENEIVKESKDLVINKEMSNHLLASAKWGRFFGVLAYIGAVIMFIFALMYIFIDALSVSSEIIYWENIKFVFFIFFIACAVLYFIWARLIMQSSKSIKTGINQNNQVEVENGTRKLAFLMKFMGIITIVGICLYFVFILSITVFAGINAFQTL